MKHLPWLEHAEYVSLFGAGVGAVASVVSQQIIYTAAPLSCLLLLNLVNRRRFEQLTQQQTTTAISQLDRRLSGNLKTLHREVLALPTFADLSTLRKRVFQHQQESISELQQEIASRLAPFQTCNLNLIHQDIGQLQDQYAHLCTGLDSVTAYLQRLPTFTRVENLESAVSQLKMESTQLQVDLQGLAGDFNAGLPSLQERINHLNQKLKDLPQSFDPSLLWREIEQLHQQHQGFVKSLAPLKVTTTTLQEQIRALTHAVAEANVRPAEFHSIAELQQAIAQLSTGLNVLEQRFTALPAAPSDRYLDPELQTFVKDHIGDLPSQVAKIRKVTQNLERQQQKLRHQVNRLPQLLDAGALQSQLQCLTARIEGVEGNMAEARTQIEAAVQHQLDAINHQLPMPSSTSELIFALKSAQPDSEEDIPASAPHRTLLEQVLTQTQSHLLIVWPWPSHYSLDDDLIHKFQAVLDRQGRIEIGWGRLGEIYDRRMPRCINQRWSMNRQERNVLYHALNKLAQLKRSYPDQFSFKILGTDEQFFVCDRRFAVVGIQHLATTSTAFPELEVGLQTTDAQVIQGLMQRFNTPTLNPADVTAYLNRGATRYELGDKAGAIADYTLALQIDPHDDIAHNNRGLAHYDLGEYQAAIEDFDRALQLNPNNVAAYCNRGFSRSHFGDQAGAIADYSEAIWIDPDNTTAYFYRGLARTRLGNKLGAIADYTEAIRINPDDAMPYFYRGVARTKLGGEAGAVEDLQTAAKLFAEQGDRVNYQKVQTTLSKLQSASMAENADQALNR